MGSPGIRLGMGLLALICCIIRLVYVSHFGSGLGLMLVYMFVAPRELFRMFPFECMSFRYQTMIEDFVLST